MNWLDLACAFDWITPAAAFINDARNGPPADFGMPALAGWSRGDVRRLLSRYGVKVWGLMVNGDTLMFTVPKSQAKWAYYLLEREGVPLMYVPAAAREDETTIRHYSFWDALFGRIPKE
jgi:hypothetical protein